jgi:dTDP-4-amino-4,6-dideoxygalactose transaminase
MDAIAAVADSAGLLVVEDAAQAHGARHRGRRVGGIGQAGAFSFYPTKNLAGIGDGGAVTTDDDEIAERLRRLRNYGMRDRYEIVEAGVNSRLGEVHAAALRTVLPRLDGWNRNRARLAEAYMETFRGHDSISVPAPPDGVDPVWHLFVIGHPDRDSCARSLAARGIGTLVHYPVLPHRAPPYREQWAQGSFPVAERLSKRALSLPLYPQLEQDACERVAAAVLATVTPPA